MRQKVAALFPAHEVEQFTELFWERIQAWRADEAAADARVKTRRSTLALASASQRDGHARALGHVRPAGAAVPDRRRRRRGDRALAPDRRARAADRRRASIKVYSCDSVAGARAGSTREGAPQHQMWLQNQFHQYVAPRGRAGDPRPTARRPTSRSGRRARRSARSTRSPWRAGFPTCSARALGDDAAPTTCARFFDGASDVRRRLLGVVAAALRADARRAGTSTCCAPASSCSPSGEGRAEDIGESWRMAERARASRASRTASIRGAPSGTTTGRPGARCCRSTSASGRGPSDDDDATHKEVEQAELDGERAARVHARDPRRPARARAHAREGLFETGVAPHRRRAGDVPDRPQRGRRRAASLADARAARATRTTRPSSACSSSRRTAIRSCSPATASSRMESAARRPRRQARARPPPSSASTSC